jgi:DNA-binding beta-propeller fold protein YncE
MRYTRRPIREETMALLKAKKNLWIGTAFLAALVALGVSQLLLDTTSAAPDVQAPVFEVDPLWPKPLPNHWLLGSAIGVTVDSRDHVFVVHRQQSFNERTEIGAATTPRTAVECCSPAPPVLEFDPEGNLVGHWGGPGQGYDWPSSNHGITADAKDNLWIGGNGGDDAHILKFTRDGKFLKQFGKPGVRRGAGYTEKDPKWVGGSDDKANFGRVAKISFDNKANEAYVADGYLNKRVAVIDVDSGAFKRYWGAYGNKPDDADPGRYVPSDPPAKQFRNPVHCSDPSNDGFVYVCDRPNDRIQVFKLDGTFVKEKVIAKETLGDGSVWDIAFSKDPQQKFIYIADGKNEKVYILDRQSLEVLTTFGDGGRQPGQFFGVHSIATDSKGNIYTTETYEGKRIQKFVYKGMGAVTKKDQGPLWPKKSSE